MKRITLSLVFIAITAIAFSQTTCPNFFKRNNGNGGGCDAKITLFFTTCPSFFQVTGLIDNGQAIAGLTFSTSACANGKIEVCIQGSNIPTAGSLTVIFTDGVVVNGIANNDTCRVPEGGVNPVKLSGFFVSRKNATVAISWKSESEINSKEYIIQRKTGSVWVDIATLASANSANGSTYTYSDNNSSKALSQYRLKMVDIDASFTNSEIRIVKGNGTAADFTVFPNPSSGNAKVSISDISESTNVQLIDNSGRVLKNVSMNNSSSIDFTNIQKGMYLIRIINKNSGESLTKKLTVVN